MNHPRHRLNAISVHHLLVTVGMQTLIEALLVALVVPVVRGHHLVQGEIWMTFCVSNAARRAITRTIVSSPSYFRLMCHDQSSTLGNNKNRPGNRGGLERQRRYGGGED